MNKNITIFGLMLAVAFLGWIFFSGQCGNKVPDHKQDYKQVQAEKDSVIAREQIANRKADSLKAVVAKTDSAFHSVTEKNKSLSKDYLHAASEAKRLTLALHGEKDTVILNTGLDSLEARIDDLTYLYNDSQQYADSLGKLYTEQKLTYEELLNQKAQLYSQLRLSYDMVDTKYTDLYKDYKTQSKSLKREKLKSKIAAALALVATGFMIAK